MLNLFSMTDTRPTRYPLPPGKAGELIHQPWLGTASERENFDYATFVGDLIWVTKTRFDLKFAAHTLATHMRNPGPHQVNAANHVLRYLFGTKDLALTFSNPEHPSGWPLQHKLLTTADAGIHHFGEPGILAL